MTNTDLWDRLGKTDPKHTKPFQRSGGFKGTAIKPIYSYRRMTEEFGPCGTGWGINAPTFQVVTGSDGEMLVYCTASIWYGDKDKVVFGVGGDKAVVKQSGGLRGDDEAFKKAFTDGITNALKMIGVGADVHMGMFDDDKYVNSIKGEFADEAKSAPPPVTLIERNGFMVECREAIAGFTDPDLLTTWWMSDAQKKARREYELDQSQVDTLKVAVMDRRKALTDKKAA
jgi:hypothetical protein